MTPQCQLCQSWAMISSDGACVYVAPGHGEEMAVLHVQYMASTVHLTALASAATIQHVTSLKLSSSWDGSPESDDPAGHMPAPPGPQGAPGVMRLAAGVCILDMRLGFRWVGASMAGWADTSAWTAVARVCPRTCTFCLSACS